MPGWLPLEWLPFDELVLVSTSFRVTAAGLNVVANNQFLEMLTRGSPSSWLIILIDCRLLI